MGHIHKTSIMIKLLIILLKKFQFYRFIQRLYDIKSAKKQELFVKKSTLHRMIIPKIVP